MKRQDHWVVLCVAIAVLAGCGKEEPETPLDVGLAFFPTEVGTWVEYQVDSMWRDDATGVHDSISYPLRVEVAEAYTDPGGRPSQRIKRHVRNDEGEWVVRDVWTATRSGTMAELTEENKRRFKLAFPARDGVRWDHNVLNTDPEQEVTIEEAGASWSVNGLSFSSTLVVRNTEPANLVERRDHVERYAHGVGMVSKHQEETTTNFQYPPGQPPVPVVRGFRFNMTVTAHGQ